MLIETWGAIIASGWGPSFAAASVLAHLRNRDLKQAEDDLFRARWYYARLYEGAAGEPEEATELAAPWGAALARLEMILTNEELVRIRGSE